MPSEHKILINFYYIHTYTQEPEKKTQKDAPKTTKEVSEKEKQAEVKFASLKSASLYDFYVVHWYSALLYVVRTCISILCCFYEFPLEISLHLLRLLLYYQDGLKKD